MHHLYEVASELYTMKTYFTKNFHQLFLLILNMLTKNYLSELVLFLLGQKFHT